jgi:Response regulator containing CheY-like receiver domain and AraC-type DNA-binding domain
VVDDREIFRRQIKRVPFIKESQEFSVSYEAQNGAEAMNILQTNKVDIVITDIKMPVMDGLALLKEIKENDLCQCVVLLSEYTDFTYAKQGMVLGAFDFIVKPIESIKLVCLLDRVKEFLDNIKRDELYTENEITMLNALILKNDEYAMDVAMQLFYRIKKAKADNLVEMSMEIDKMLKKIRKAVEGGKDWLEKFVDMDCLFSFEMIRSIAEAEHFFREKMDHIIYEVNKLNVLSRNKLIQDTCADILLNVEDSNMNLKSIAERHYVNKTYLSHIFKIEVGISFVDYVTFAKMERAKILLKTTNLKIYELAEMMGYSDSEYFGRLFKKSTGISANSYKQIINN